MKRRVVYNGIRGAGERVTQMTKPLEQLEKCGQRGSNVGIKKEEEERG